MVCPKDIFAELYRLNMVLGPVCRSDEAKTAFNEYVESLDEASTAFAAYEQKLHSLRQVLESQTKMEKCKVHEQG